VAVRAVFDTHEALPDVPIIGVGGVASAVDAVEFLMAGASAIQVGTATFADPAAPALILRDLGRWCDDHGVAHLSELIGAAHD
jgi:dihydroorotate dehydrogenase (NAD+) catalytic subunit